MLVSLLLLSSWFHVAVICSLSLLHGTMGWSVVYTVCDCGITWSYSFTFF